MNPILLAVIGKPVLHSKSPAIQNAALLATDTPGRYLRLAPRSAMHALQVAREIGITGLNITAPFKQEMAEAVSQRSDAATRAEAVNTVVLSEHQTYGWNTDIYGVQQAFEASGISLGGNSVLLLGAGGAAKAALIALTEKGCHVTIANRSLEKARALASEFGCEAISLAESELTTAMRKSRIVLNITSTVERILPPSSITPQHTVMDSQYAKVTTLVADARAQGARIINGRDWNIFQGIEAFKHFTGKEVTPAIMRSGFESAEPISKTRISLIGMMGTGKSTAAKLLAERLNWKLLELDEVIESRAKRSIPEIFRDGEADFRTLEKDILAEVMQEEHVVISCGGGVVVTEANRKLLSKDSLCIWLWAKNTELISRIGADTNRPLLAGGSPKEKLDTIFDSRRLQYAEACHLVMPTEGLTPAQVVERVLYESSYVW